MARASDPVRALAGATWVVKTLRGAGHVAYFAGGCVRDALLGLSPTDFDVATDATPDRVRRLFPRSDLVGASFGVVIVHVPREVVGGGADSPRVDVEVATFRTDGPYTDARRPDSVRFAGPVEDAQRRDFTINALFVDPLAPGRAGGLEGALIDHVGGAADLERRVVRAVGDADARLGEDHLRALRAVRFAARLGFEIEPATAAAIARHALQLRGVSRERIGEELRRMLAHPARRRGVGLLQELGLDTPVLDDVASCSSLRLLGALPPNACPTTAIAAWLLDRAWAEASPQPAWIDVTRKRGEPGPLVRVRAALCLSNDECETLEQMLRLSRHLAMDWPRASVAQRKRWAHGRTFDHALSLVQGWSAKASESIAQAVDLLAADGIGLGPTPLVTGDDLVASGITPGPLFKSALDAAYDAQLEGRVASKAAALELARAKCV